VNILVSSKSSVNSFDISKNRALKFIIIIGIVSLFADMTYEGARSITGPYLAMLGASAVVVGFVAGFGELVGYGLRIFSGYAADKSGKYWSITLFGYTVNLLAVPLLALAGRWEVAAVLIILERTGKAIRVPARDAMLSHATKKVGRGWGFGLHEALDQIGALLGPIIVAVVLFLRGGYQNAFAILLIPALLALSVLMAAKLLYPHPRSFEPYQPQMKRKGLPRVFWIYVIAAAFLAIGYADFPLIAFHFQKASVVSTDWIPVFYAVAMGVDALAAMAFGRLFDRIGVSSMVIISAISWLFAPLVFLGDFNLALLGMVLWGIGMGAQESIMRAAVAEMSPSDKRASAYGIFNTLFGLSWFAGSVAMGFLYDLSIVSLVIFSSVAILLSIPFFLLTRRPLKTFGGENHGTDG
jgi:MFS family permease